MIVIALSVKRNWPVWRQVLNAMGVSPKAQKLPPQAVRYICEDYCIDLPPSL